MSTYGLKTFDAAGNPIVEITDRLNRHRYNNEVNAGASSNTTLADIDGQLTIEMSIMINPPITYNLASYAPCPHEIIRSGTTITWTAASETFVTSNDSLLLLFFYV
jgi:hypothetical protein